MSALKPVMTVKRLWIICGPLIYLLFSTFNESIMPCEIKVLIELYGPIDTGVIIWITNIIGKIDCISFYLPSFDPRFDRHRAFLTFSKRYSNWHYIYVFYFFSHIWSRAQFFFSFFFFFFFLVTDRQLKTDLSHFLIPNDLRLAKSLW